NKYSSILANSPPLSRRNCKKNDCFQVSSRKLADSGSLAGRAHSPANALLRSDLGIEQPLSRMEEVEHSCLPEFNRHQFSLDFATGAVIHVDRDILPIAGEFVGTHDQQRFVIRCAQLQGPWPF